MPAKISTNSKLAQRQLRELGQRIRNRRKELKVNSTDTAEAAEISRVTLYRIEKGEPSVAMAAYMSVIIALGLKLDVVDSLIEKSAEKSVALPKKIRIANYKQLKRLAWQLDAKSELTPQEALNLYERNWRHVDLGEMDSKEKKFLESLLKAFKRERLLV